MTMNPEIKQEWLDLLATNPPQIKRRLGTKKGNCVEGLLCEIAVKHGVIEKYYNEQDGLFYYGSMRMSTSTPTEVDKWSGYSDQIINDDVDNLALLNDEGLTFAQLSDIIKYFL